MVVIFCMGSYKFINTHAERLFQNCSICLLHVPENSFEGFTKVAASSDNDA